MNKTHHTSLLTKWSICLLFLVHFAFKLNAQTQNIKISGRASDQRNPNEKVECVVVTLSFEGKEYTSVDCDSLGNYKLEIPAELFKNQTGKLSVKQDWKCIQKKATTAKNCPYISTGPVQYLDNRDYKLITFGAGQTNYIADFSLEPMIIDGSYPNTFYFKKNSVQTIKLDQFHPDTALLCEVSLLQKYPTQIIELRSQGWHERRKKHLAEKRALYIKNKFIAAGIDSNRFVITITSGFVLSNRDVKQQAKTKEERQRLASLNRRVTLVILSFDYDPKLKKRIEEKPKAKDEEGDD